MTSCTQATLACSYTDRPQQMPQMYVWRRPTGSDEAWQFQGATCIVPDLPGVQAPPPVPTLAQIQEAFRRLPFGKPAVHVQPEGGVTLVNLPTYYEAQWPAAGLSPGELSKPVQLLSWRVQFEVSSQSYDFDFGDGARSGPTPDPGGPYPSGRIRHTYTTPDPSAAVRVDARLTGRFRVNGGDWQDLDTVADLLDEPVTTLQVREATARLYAR